MPSPPAATPDPRRRPVAATVAYGVTFFAILAWRLPSRPSLAAMAPTAPETILALLLTIVAALLGGLAARWLPDQLRGQVLHSDIPSVARSSADSVPV